MKLRQKTSSRCDYAELRPTYIVADNGKATMRCQGFLQVIGQSQGRIALGPNCRGHGGKQEINPSENGGDRHQ